MAATVDRSRFTTEKVDIDHDCQAIAANSQGLIGKSSSFSFKYFSFCHLRAGGRLPRLRICYNVIHTQYGKDKFFRCVRRARLKKKQRGARQRVNFAALALPPSPSSTSGGLTSFSRNPYKHFLERETRRSFACCIKNDILTFCFCFFKILFDQFLGRLAV